MTMLYHASSTQGLKHLQPRNQCRRRSYDPPRVYTAKQRIIAVMFIVTDLDDRWGICGSWDGRKSWWRVIGDEERFRQMEEKGGSLYTVSSEGFMSDPDIGLGDEELYSTSTVPVLKEEKWDSALAAMLHYGLNVMFVDKS